MAELHPQSSLRRRIELFVTLSLFGAFLTVASSAFAAPSFRLTKTASPTSRPAPGGSFNFAVLLTNIGSAPFTITSLTDNIYGNIANQGTCTNSVGTVVAAGGSYSCSFNGSFTGSAGSSQTDTVTAFVVDSVGASANRTAQATVTITAAVPPTINVTKTASPTSRPAPGGSFNFAIIITNTTSGKPVTITSLTDDVYGNIGNQGTCVNAVGTVLAASGGSFSCSFNGSFFGSSGTSQTDTVTAVAVDNNGATASDTAQATVTLTAAVPPTINVTKTASPTSRPAPGGSFNFAIVITNTTTGKPVTITSLTDDVYGNIGNQGTCVNAVGTVLAASGGSFSCSFNGSFFGSSGTSQTDTVTAVVVDSNGATASDTAQATVTLTALRGDANGDGQITVSDVFYLVSFLFASGQPPIGNGDANADGSVTVADVFYLVNFLFAGGAPPPP